MRERQMKISESLENQIRLKRDKGVLDYFQGVSERANVDKAKIAGDAEEIKGIE